MNQSTPATEEVVRLEKLRKELSSDIAAMQQKEANLREYENKLRMLVEQASASQPPLSLSQSVAPINSANSHAALNLEWEKFYRAQAQLEAARRGLTEERLALKDREEKAVLREQELERREAQLRAREQQLSGKPEAKPQPAADSKSRPAFTTAPFVVKNMLTLTRHT